MSARLPTTGTLTGTVAEFDFDRGLGVVETADGRRLGFHCTSIADGSRRIAVGTAVSFRLAAAPGGRYEAAALTPVAAPGGRR